jgi:hypothetical protein
LYKGVRHYELTRDHKFVASKLIVITQSWDTETEFVEFEYEGEQANYNGTDSQLIDTTRAGIEN